ncbi:SapC family protein [Sphingomonas sp. ID0503]|uniref:SapC family protein n=1 Tax=Sphingomonas sp. ID0503 TaxID=3399691 RepID=UPI003AFA6DA3
MASAPQNLPLFYQQLEPLSTQRHADFKVRRTDTIGHLANTHAVPITVDEFTLGQRHYPIVFSVGPSPVPLALLGLNEGVNTFVGQDGKVLDESVYIPAYARRYPFMLARLREGNDEMSLCFDPSCELIGAFDEGEALFEDGNPSAATRAILEFAEQYEMAMQRTASFMNDIVEAKLLMEGELTINAEGVSDPIVYRGFQIINEEALIEMRGDQLRKLMRAGAIGLIYAQTFSLRLTREVFDRQVRQGKGPIAAPAKA